MRKISVRFKDGPIPVADAITASRTADSTVASITPPRLVSGSTARQDVSEVLVTSTTGPIFQARFTTVPNASDVPAVEQCWSSIMTWRNASAIWFNSHVADRTWPLGPITSPVTWPWYSSTTIYPTSVSTYTLCDGSQRANVVPITHHSSGNSTSIYTITGTLTPKFSQSQPCTPDPGMCRQWYYGSNIRHQDENELINQCGFPAHLDAPCLIGGGPVRLVYFPVNNGPSNACANSSSPFSPAPREALSTALTTLGHTFDPSSVYLSFRTLYASYDGFWDRLGPTFTNLLLPLPSTAISTQCGPAFGPGTPLVYADLNRPVPASAYSCQNRCPATLTSSCETCLGYTATPASECATIWDDVNPVLAVPTEVRQLAREWEKCEFWDVNIPNFWFDPPIALEAVSAIATPTVGGESWRTSSMSAAPSATAKSPNGEPTSGFPRSWPSDSVATSSATLTRKSPSSPVGEINPSTSVSNTHTHVYSSSSNSWLPQPPPSLNALPILTSALSSRVIKSDPALQSIISSLARKTPPSDHPTHPNETSPHGMNPLTALPTIIGTSPHTTTTSGSGVRGTGTSAGVSLASTTSEASRQSENFRQKWMVLLPAFALVRAMRGFR